MIYNLPRKKAKFEETWVLNESPDWKNLFSAFYTGDLVNLRSVVSIKFISNNVEFDSIRITSS